MLGPGFLLLTGGCPWHTQAPGAQRLSRVGGRRDAWLPSVPLSCRWAAKHPFCLEGETRQASPGREDPLKCSRKKKDFCPERLNPPRAAPGSPHPPHPSRRPLVPALVSTHTERHAHTHTHAQSAPFREKLWGAPARGLAQQQRGPGEGGREAPPSTQPGPAERQMWPDLPFQRKPSLSRFPMPSTSSTSPQTICSVPLPCASWKRGTTPSWKETSLWITPPLP